MINKILILSCAILAGQFAMAAYYKCPEGIIDTDRPNMINFNETLSGEKLKTVSKQIQDLKANEKNALDKYQCIKLSRGFKVIGKEKCYVYYDGKQNVILDTCIPAPSGKRYIPAK